MRSLDHFIARNSWAYWLQSESKFDFICQYINFCRLLEEDENERTE